MSKSSPPLTNTEPLPLPLAASRTSPFPKDLDLTGRGLPSSNPPPRPARKLSHQFAAAVRWLHIYVSLLGFTALLFFSVTGITLNHPTWFGAGLQNVTELKGNVDPTWVKPQAPSETDSAAPSGTGGDGGAAEPDPAAGIAKLEVVEHLRKAHGLRGAVSEFRVDDIECMILFKGPGYAADVFLDRASGSYTVTQTVMGLMAVMNDLHKGRDSGSVWSWVIDLTAALMVFVSITGFVLIFYLRRKRVSGVVTAVVGTIVFIALGMYWVP